MTVAAATVAYERARANFERAAADLRCAIDRDSLRLMVDSVPDATVQSVIQAVAEETGVGVVEILGYRRHRLVADARMLAISLSREAVTLSPELLGRLFRRDHSTVRWACRAMDRRIATEPAYAALVARLRARLGLPSPRI